LICDTGGYNVRGVDLKLPKVVHSASDTFAHRSQHLQWIVLHPTLARQLGLQGNLVERDKLTCACSKYLENKMDI
jgi:hypothetical protein